ncbi:MAG: hypothetical protein ACYCW6_18345 [Candidatus Xenobia bacterium]
MDPIGTVRPRPVVHGTLREGRLQQAARRGNVQARNQLHQLWHRIIDSQVAQQDGGEMQMALPQVAKRYRAEPDDEFAQYRMHAMVERAQELHDAKLLARIHRVRNGDMVRVRPQALPAHSDWCGITSVAMVSEKMTGRGRRETYASLRHLRLKPSRGGGRLNTRVCASPPSRAERAGASFVRPRGWGGVSRW